MSMPAALLRNVSREACSTDDAAIGKEGDDDSSLYQVNTKSRIIMTRMSLSAADMTGDSGYKSGNDCGVFWDHCDRVRTACHAAGVENANGRATFERLFRGDGRLASKV